MDLSDRPRRQERRRLITGRHEDAIGDARVEMHVLVERRAEAVDEGDGTDPRACGGGSGGGTREACRSACPPKFLLLASLCAATIGRTPGLEWWWRAGLGEVVGMLLYGPACRPRGSMAGRGKSASAWSPRAYVFTARLLTPCWFG